MTCCIFTGTTISWSAPMAYEVKVSENVGKVKQSFKGNESLNKLVVLVEDAHGSFDAQKNIANIVCELVNQIHVGEIDHEEFDVQGAECKVQGEESGVAEGNVMSLPSTPHPAPDKYQRY